MASGKNKKDFNKAKKSISDSNGNDQIKKPNYFIIIGSNGSKIIANALLKLKLQRIQNNSDKNYYVKWTDVPSQIDWENFTEFKQMVNHVPNSNLITNKANLLQSLRQLNRITKLMQKSSNSNEIESFIPESYHINNVKELEEFYENIEKHNIWIYKPTDLNQGIGISLIRDKESFDNVLSKDLKLPNISRRPTGRIIQRYITNPLLLNNKKFDVRAYMLIANTTPFLVLYHSGYLRLSLEEYTNDSENLLVHLTNQYVQKKDPAYEAAKDDTVWSMEQFSRYLNSNLKSYPQISRNWVKNVFLNRMKFIMRQVFLSVKHKLMRRVGIFELFGFDFMIDSDFKVWLIEVNVNPALDTNCTVLKEKLPILVESTFDIVFECFEKCKHKVNILPLQNMASFEIVFSEESNWNWQRYLGGTKLNGVFVKTQKVTNKNSLANSSDKKEDENKQENQRFQRESTILSRLQKAYSTSPSDARKFPLPITQKLYKESNFFSSSANLKWIKT